MATTVTIPDNCVPAGATVVEPVSCENCARPLYRAIKQRRICPCCVSAFEIGAQVWCCVECGTARKYGEMRPEETSKKFLKCSRCCLITQHEFFEVFRG